MSYTEQLNKIYWFHTMSGYYFKGRYIGNGQYITTEIPMNIVFTPTSKEKVEVEKLKKEIIELKDDNTRLKRNSINLYCTKCGKLLPKPKYWPIKCKDCQKTCKEQTPYSLKDLHNL